MPKASPAKLSFTSGEFSVLVEGRTDHEKYPFSARRIRNYIVTPQGPLIRRSGTYLMTEAFSHDKNSALIPWVFSDEQAEVLEFADSRVRFLAEQGIVVYSHEDATAVVTVSPFVVTSATLNANVNDQVIISGFAPTLNLEGVRANITAKAGNDYTLDVVYTGAAGALTGGEKLARVYHINSPFPDTVVRNINYVQDIDIMYLFAPGFKPRKLSRKGAYDWDISTVTFIDGPYIKADDEAPLLTPSSQGLATVPHTTYVSATGTVSASSERDGRLAWYAFDNVVKSGTSHWKSNTIQTGTIEYEFAVPTAIQGYVIYLARESTEGFALKELGPATWTFDAWDGTQWITLDEQFGYTQWTGLRSLYFDTKNKTAYTKYRIDISEMGNSSAEIRPRVGEIHLRVKGNVSIDFALDGVQGVNKGQGMLATDIGRALRIYQSDGYWRALEITAVADTTHFTAKLKDGPLYDTNPIRRWQLGYFSDTTGWPTTATWYADRLAVGGSAEWPTLVAMSKPGDGFYEIFSPTDPNGTVNDDNGIALLLKTRKQSRIRWLEADDNWLLVGSSGNEWAIGPNTENQVFSARNVRARPSSRRGSADIKPERIDRQVLFIDRMKRQLYEHAYRYEEDGYKSPSMSILSQHLGATSFEQIVYQSQPHSIAWVRREEAHDTAAVTYNREEKVVGWHTHDYAGGDVLSMAVIPSLTDRQDTVWLLMRRNINGNTKRYIERMKRFWDFGDTLDVAHFVDCGRRATLSAPTTTIQVGLFLEGKAVCGLADDKVFGVEGDVIVTNGQITLPFTAEEYITVGLGYDSYVETERMEAGAADGTAQGKIKRIHSAVISVWDSYGGEVGGYDEDQKKEVWSPIPRDENGELLEEAIVLQTGMINIPDIAQFYGRRGSILVRQKQPLPMNIISILPQIHTQDGG